MILVMDGRANKEIIIIRSLLIKIMRCIIHY